FPSAPVSHHLAPPLFPYTTLFRSRGAHVVARRPVGRLAHRREILLDQGVQARDQPLGQRLLRGEVVEQASFGDPGPGRGLQRRPDRKSTRLNSSHVSISYAVFCLK